MLRIFVAVIFLLMSGVFAFGQRRVAAVRTETAPKIDADLSDPAWKMATPVTGFTQNFPSLGSPASAQTEVRLLYDDAAIYVSAYLYDDPSQIRRQLTSRDGEQRQDVDYFSIYFDTYNDQQNGFQFLATTANVQTDARLGGGSNGEGEDRSWDAVWQSSTSMRSDGWTLEMRIPYISLRFTKKELQTWGLQLQRFTRRNNESAFWNPVSPNISGLVNQFGKLEGLRNLEPPLRLSFSPYLSTGVRFNPEGYQKRTEFLRSGGMDLKWGLNESFTLDATLIPDFGQVISDNVVNNLTPYEIRFQENRPFFTEGTELFNKSGLFYSRRIGARPSGYNRVERNYGGGNPVYEIVSNPTLTQLYNAVKISGRNKQNLGIGMFNAIAAPMEARVRNRNTKLDSLIETEPLTNYNLFVLDKAFKGRSFVTFTNASTIRHGANRDANVTAFDWGLYNKANSHVLSGTMRYSHVLGYTPYSSAYFMNRDTVTINGARYLKPYDGMNARLRMAKVSGRIRYSGSVNLETVGYDPNDLGYLAAPNEVTYLAGVSYNEFSPKKHFINYSYSFNAYYIWLFRPYRYAQIEFAADADWLFKNFWDIEVIVGGQPKGQTDYFELRNPDLRVKKPAFGYINVSGSTDSRKKLFVSYGFGFEHNAIPNSPFFLVDLGIRYRFSDRFTLALNTTRQHDHLQVGNAYVPGEFLIGYRSNKELTPILSGTYNFTSRMNLTLRARHYWNQVKYKSFYSVDADGDHIPHAFVDGMDQNVNAFNLDAFYTWDFRAGSRIIVGWKNALGDEEGIPSDRYKDYFNNLGRSFDLSHGNELTLRLIYFLDYNQFKRKRPSAASNDRVFNDRINGIGSRRLHGRQSGKGSEGR